MNFLYKTGIFAYSILLKTLAPFHSKARLFVNGRKNWQKNLAEKIETNVQYIWFHCASLGEFEQGRPVIEEVRKRFPHYQIILTFFSPSGYEIRKNYELADIVMYLPLDTRGNAKKFIKMVRPAKAFFIKYEYWYYYIDELKKQNIPLYIISAIFREKQPFFKNNRWAKWYREMLLKTEHMFVQDTESAKLLQAAGIHHFTISGDTRFDRVEAISRNVRKIPVVEKFRANYPLLVAGSTWKPDEELLATFINNQTKIKIIIAPHEVTPANLSRLEQMLKKPAIRFSQVTETNIDQFQVLIIDSIGLLSSLYQYGNLAYIGGGFGVGIHNILEAATFGIPVIFGPNYKKFREAVELKNKGGAFPIQDFNQLENILNDFLSDQNKLKKASEICKKYVAGNIGSTQIILEKVFNI